MAPLMPLASGDGAKIETASIAASVEYARLRARRAALEALFGPDERILPSPLGKRVRVEAQPLLPAFAPSPAFALPASPDDSTALDEASAPTVVPQPLGDTDETAGSDAAAAATAALDRSRWE